MVSEPVLAPVNVHCVSKLEGQNYIIPKCSFRNSLPP